MPTQETPILVPLVQRDMSLGQAKHQKALIRGFHSLYEKTGRYAFPSPDIKGFQF